MFSKKRKKRRKEEFKPEFLLSEKSPFSIQEAYKTLRTNLIFSTPESQCRVIVVTSPEQGQTKSMTSINLSIALAQNELRVLLLECDLRLPVIAERLDLDDSPGLCNFLAGSNKVDDLLRKTDSGIYVIVAGEISPNPSELLGSAKMKGFLKVMKKHFDYIIIDTPPVNMVSDALLLSKEANEVVLTVRQNATSREEVDEAVSRLEFAEAKILGFVMTDVKNDTKYGYRRKKGYYYSYYNQRD